MLSIEARKLAMKLTDAGLTDDEALEWVREILAEAWDFGYASGLGDCGKDRMRETCAANPYETDSLWH